MEQVQIKAPRTIVDCIEEFVASLRNEWDTLAVPLAQALEQDVAFVDDLLNQLNELFITEQ